MKRNSFTNALWSCLCLAVLLVATGRSFAQNTPVSNSIPTVLIAASDASATEAGDPGMFHIYRDGVATNVELTVALAIGGTASNGVDYAELPRSVTFAVGARVVELTVLPIQDSLVEGTETVILKLLPATAGGSAYNIGVYSNATVNIADDDVAPPTNHAPAVYISSPTNNSVIVGPTNILIRANAYDQDTNDIVQTVEFLSGTTSLGVVSNTAPGGTPNSASAFQLNWSNVPLGVYELRARATDSRGASTTSATVRITVTNTPPPPTNRAPSVYIYSPTNNAVIAGPTNILIRANAYDPDTNDIVQTVEFFSGTTSLGVVSNTAPGGTPNSVSAFQLNWSDVPLGVYELRARATDSRGASTLSATVRITVTNVPPSLPVVTIVATDAQAEEIPPVPAGSTNVQRSNPALFTVTRTGDTNLDLAVTYTIGGTASNGVDYATLPGSVTIPAGAATATIQVNPIDDLLVEGTETVILHLVAPDCATVNPPPVGCYRLGTALEAKAYIADNEPPTNNPPVVTITAPDAIAIEGTNLYQWPGLTNTTSVPPSYYTNNTATFLIRRTGDTNTPLDVRYNISGSASNGVDYATLSGAATIPAGRSGVEIIIRPIDDDLVETNETVVLTLRLPAETSTYNTTNPPPYKLGSPYRAAAIIVDNDRPRPTTGALPDRSFNLTVPGTDGTWYRVEYSSDLVNWTPVCTNMVTKGAVQFVDPEASELAKRYYRAIVETNPPAIQP